jgi:hypothetical protein
LRSRQSRRKKGGARALAFPATISSSVCIRRARGSICAWMRSRRSGAAAEHNKISPRGEIDGVTMSTTTSLGKIARGEEIDHATMSTICRMVERRRQNGEVECTLSCWRRKASLRGEAVVCDSPHAYVSAGTYTAIKVTARGWGYQTILVCS